MREQKLKRRTFYDTKDEYWGVVEILTVETCNPNIFPPSPFFYRGEMYIGIKISGILKKRVFYTHNDDIDVSKFLLGDDYPEYLL